MYTHRKKCKLLPAVGPKIWDEPTGLLHIENIYKVSKGPNTQCPRRETLNTKAGGAKGRTTGGWTTNVQDHEQEPEAGPPADTGPQTGKQKRTATTANRNRQQQSGTDSKSSTETDSKTAEQSLSNSSKWNRLTSFVNSSELLA